MANPSLYVLLPFTFFLLILHFLFSQASKNPNVEPLLAFNACTDKANKLTTWNLELHHQPMYLDRRLVPPRPSLATRPQRPRSPGLVRVTHCFDSTLSSQPQAKPSLRSHS